MIWGFLMGMIAGAVGVFLLAKWWVEEHVVFYEEDEDDEQTEIGGECLDGELAAGEEGRTEKGSGKESKG